MKPVRFVVIGGFLGAGKTTLLCRLAEHYVELGKKVGIITNDQAEDLVDTKLVELRGFRAKEIPGGCFCCRFDDLIEAAQEFMNETELEVLLGEPVGSCADLAATVIQPLRRKYRDLFEVAPYSVAVDPFRLEELLLKKRRKKFQTLLSYLAEEFLLKRKRPKLPASIAYLFTKQLEEADLILLNKVDLLAQIDRRRMLGFLKERFVNAVVVGISARTGEGLDRWLDILKQKLPAGSHLLKIDYDLYAQAEAELGWLNAIFKLSRREAFPSGTFLQELCSALRQRFSLHKAEVAHLKILLDSEKGGSFINLVRGEAQPELGGDSEEQIQAATLIINGRIQIDPELLRQTVTEAIEAISRKLQVSYSLEKLSSFRPAYPTPKYRYEVSTEE